MAQLTEGRCFNCGSLLLLNPKQEKGHCLYCDAVFPVEQAFEIQKNPDAYEFKNEPQPEYTGPNLDPYTKPTHVTFDAAPKAVAGGAKGGSEAPAYKIQKKEIPDVVADPKTMKLIVAGILAVLVVFLAVTIPLNVKRDNDRERMANEFAAKIQSIAGHEETAKLGEDFIIERTDNSKGILILNELKDEEEALQYFKAFTAARGTSRSGHVTLDILTQDRSFRVSTEGPEATPVVEKLEQ